MKRAVALLSGGMDSVTAAAITQAEGFEVHALAVDYGQRALPELDCARRLSEALRMEVAGSAVKVSCIEPGLVMTELHRDLPVHPKDSLGVARPLAPADIARMVLFVAEQPDHVAVPRLMVLPQDQAL